MVSILEKQHSYISKYKNRQWHGQDFENRIHIEEHGRCKEEYDKIIPGKTCSDFDLVEGYNSEHNISVKTTKTNSVGFGDIIRAFTNFKRENFKIVIGHYDTINSVNNTLKFHKITIIDYEPLYFNVLWGNIQLSSLQSFDQYVKGIAPGKEAQLENQQLWKEKRECIYNKDGLSKFRINAKIDSKTQRRTQATIRYTDLLESGMHYEVYTSNYKNITLPYVVTKGS